MLHCTLLYITAHFSNSLDVMCVEEKEKNMAPDYIFLNNGKLMLLMMIYEAMSGIRYQAPLT